MSLALTLTALALATIVVEQPEVRPPLGGQSTAAAYMILRNTGPTADRLIGATCACAASIMAHRTVDVGGVSHMETGAMAEIPAGGSVAFAPGGRHLMLMGVKSIRAGTKVPMVLRFEKAGPRTVQFNATNDAGLVARAH